MTGEIDVRNITASISCRMPRSVFSMISSVTVSITPSRPRSGDGAAARRSSRLQDEVRVLVDAGARARMHERGRILLLDDRRACELVSGPQQAAGVDRRLEPSALP